VKWDVEGGYNQGHFENLPRGGWVVCLFVSGVWMVCMCKSARPYQRLGQAQVRAPARQVSSFSQKSKMAIWE